MPIMGRKEACHPIHRLGVGSGREMLLHMHVTRINSNQRFAKENGVRFAHDIILYYFMYVKLMAARKFSTGSREEQRKLY
jgi:hypothetical protein